MHLHSSPNPHPKHPLSLFAISPSKLIFFVKDWSLIELAFLEQHLQMPEPRLFKITSTHDIQINKIITPFAMIDINWMEHYYVSNNIWVYGNLVLILPFIIACINRIRHPDINKYLWTDHLSRFFLVFTVLYYIYDMPVKYFVDGGETICQKGFFIHHFSSLFIIPPIIFNSYIPWWANPIGFLHGFCLLFPEFQPLNYIYAAALMFFHFGIYQKPFRDLKGYWLTRLSINGVWLFALFLLIGDCSNFLPLGPDS